MTPPSASPPPRTSILTGYPAAVAVILLMYIVGLWSSTASSATFDEPAHMVGGYIHWTLGQPRIHTENGYLSQAIAAFPILFAHPHPIRTDTAAFKQADPFLLGREFLYMSGNDASMLLLLARGAIGVLTGATAFAVYAWSRKLFSPRAAIFSLVLFCASPLILSHGFLATSDMAVTCFFALSLAASWWALQRPSAVRLLLSALAMTTLFLSKMSAPVIIPVLLLLAIVHVLAGGPALSRARRAAHAAAIIGFQAIAVWILIWAAYGFTYSAMEDSPPGSRETFRPDNWTWALQDPTPSLRVIAFARDHHLLPESYLYGYAYVRQTERVVISYVDGTVSRTGWWWFYPYAFLLTTPIPVLLAIALSVVAVAQWSRRATSAQLRARIVAVSPLLLFFVVYWIAAIASYRGTGPRHLLPVYPVLCILAGAGIYGLKSARFSKVAFGAIVAWLLVEGAIVSPFYLSYFNELAGGPSNGYRHFVDSSVDWGQGLPALGDYIATHPSQEPTYFSYFGSADPGYYGIHLLALPSFIRAPGEDDPSDYNSTLMPGTYFISVTQLSGLYQDWGRYTPKLEKGYQEARQVYPMRDRLLLDPRVSPHDRAILRDLPQQFRYGECARLFAYLRSRPADAQIAYSINVYHLSPAELARALDGAPVYEGQTVHMR